MKMREKLTSIFRRIFVEDRKYGEYYKCVRTNANDYPTKKDTIKQHEQNIRMHILILIFVAIAL